MIYEENTLFMDVYTSSNILRNSINKLNSFYPKYVRRDEGTFSLENSLRWFICKYMQHDLFSQFSS